MKHEYETVTRFKKRERTQNWTFSEKKFLLDLCRRDMKIIENKRLDSALIALKNRAWRLIHQRFASTFGPDRNCNRLKEQFRRMKALSRSEILDYSHRLSRFGQDVADRKRPSAFSFEIWEFMQEAKKVCKAESMDNVDYSKMESSLERDDFDNSNSSNQEDDSLCTTIMNKTSQNMDMCEVQIKEEPGSDVECISDPSNPSESPKRVDNQLMDRDMPATDLSNISATINTVNLMENIIPLELKKTFIWLNLVYFNSS
uniref:Regulatory protein zeste n=1 Tax=Phlebotomus papatasi TaxID=29031 RepID=A0A1B0DCK8_PHLPP